MTGAHGPVVLIGPPGAGCSSVGRALARYLGAAYYDLGERTAHDLGTHQDLALVAVPEASYRRAEEACALRLLEKVRGAFGVLALGSGCLSAPKVVSALKDLEATASGHLVTLGASARTLATRNGLDAPRSVALGTVHHTFTQMLRARQALCRSIAGLEIDTSERAPEQVAAEIAAHLAAPDELC